MKLIHPILVTMSLLASVVNCSQENKECRTLKLVNKCGNEPCTYRVEAAGPFVSDHLKQTVTRIYKRSCLSPPDPTICTKFDGMDETGCLRNQCSYVVQTTEPFGKEPQYHSNCDSRLI